MVVTEIAGTAGRYANISHPQAVRFGVLRELATMVPYTIPQLWAVAFQRFGFRGVRYASRFTTIPRPNAWAIFGNHGASPLRTGAVLDGVTACQRAGILVARPTADGYTILRP
jgi:hypothetical protein